MRPLLCAVVFLTVLAPQVLCQGPKPGPDWSDNFWLRWIAGPKVFEIRDVSQDAIFELSQGLNSLPSNEVEKHPKCIVATSPPDPHQAYTTAWYAINLIYSYHIKTIKLTPKKDYRNIFVIIHPTNTTTNDKLNRRRFILSKDKEIEVAVDSYGSEIQIMNGDPGQPLELCNVQVLAIERSGTFLDRHPISVIVLLPPFVTWFLTAVFGLLCQIKSGRAMKDQLGVDKSAWKNGEPSYKRNKFLAVVGNVIMSYVICPIVFIIAITTFAQAMFLGPPLTPPLRDSSLLASVCNWLAINLYGVSGYPGQPWDEEMNIAEDDHYWLPRHVRQWWHIVVLGLVSLISTFVIFFSMFSPCVRCMVRLFILQVGSRGSRTILLTLCLASIFSGPVTNIRNNILQLIQALSCTGGQMQSLGNDGVDNSESPLIVYSNVRFNLLLAQNLQDRLIDVFNTVMTIAHIIIKLFFLRYFFVTTRNAFRYYHMYNIDLSWDNHYIDTNIERINKCIPNGDRGVLPIRYWERRKYQNDLSFFPRWKAKWKKSWRYLCEQWMNVIILCIFALTAYLADQKLYSILKEAANIADNVAGEGLDSDLSLVGTDVNVHVASRADNPCLPMPHEPQSRHILTILTPIIIWILLCLTDGFGSSRLLCDWHFKDRAKERAEYLYSAIVASRRSRRHEFDILVTRRLYVRVSEEKWCCCWDCMSGRYLPWCIRRCCKRCTCLCMPCSKMKSCLNTGSISERNILKQVNTYRNCPGCDRFLHASGGSNDRETEFELYVEGVRYPRTVYICNDCLLDAPADYGVVLGEGHVRHVLNLDKSPGAIGATVSYVNTPVQTPGGSSYNLARYISRKKLAGLLKTVKSEKAEKSSCDSASASETSSPVASPRAPRRPPQPKEPPPRKLSPSQSSVDQTLLPTELLDSKVADVCMLQP